jgi:hypothetical protein
MKEVQLIYQHERKVSSVLLPQDCHHQTQEMLGILKLKARLPNNVAHTNFVGDSATMEEYMKHTFVKEYGRY